MQDLERYCRSIAEQARAAAAVLGLAKAGTKNAWLHKAADALEARSAEILLANDCDLRDARIAGLTSSFLDRLRLDADRLASAANGMRQVAALPDPVGQVRDSRVRPNGLEVYKVGVPLGVLFFIYESRPNVTVDAAALAVKSGNSIILRGGSEAGRTNAALHRVLEDTLTACGLPVASVQLLATPNRAAVAHLLAMPRWIDLVIPRGGEELISRVAGEAQMPVLKHFKGNCHVYVHRAADPAMAENIVLNAKCQRPGVCNAAESLLVDRDLAESFLPRVAKGLRGAGVEMRGCEATRLWVPEIAGATDADFEAEYLDLIISIKVVAGIDEAIDHINRFGSHHTDTIVTGDLAAARRFTREVDSAAVLVNASTRFHDGFELGLGAEIGISTDRFHARGPCGLLELTSYKYVVLGEGQVKQ
jgi:glutamate-5-semialdehyde dehydrogenase